jgi:hypothetical protein
MNFYEAQDFFKKMYPDKKIDFSFDDNCLRQIEIVHTNGKPHTTHHLEYQNVKVDVEGQPSVYVPIAPHRMCCHWADLKKILLTQNDVYLNPDEISHKDPEELSKMTGLSVEEINKIKGL